jgi:hypothetical protein
MLKKFSKYKLSVVILFDFVFIILLCIIANNKLLYTLLAFAILNIYINYYFDINTLAKKIVISSKFKEEFNESYFDLYWRFNKLQVQLFANCTLSMISLIQFVSVTSIFLRGIVGLIFLVIGAILSSIVFSISINSMTLLRLTGKKQQNYTPYTKEEMDILNNLR